MSRTPLFWKLYPSFLVVTVIALALAGWIVSGTVRAFHLEEVRADLAAKARLVGLRLAEDGIPPGPGRLETWCRETGRSIATRITVIRPDGVVECDSVHDPATMDNHGDRPEIRRALAAGSGSSIRWSHTLGVEMMYVAVRARTRDGGTRVVRAAMPLVAVERALGQIRRRMLLAGLAAVLAAGVLCFVVSRRISRPLEELTREVQEFVGGGGRPGRGLYVGPSPPREFAILAEEIRRMERVRRDFVANVSHELKTPLTAIRGFTETLLDGAVEDRDAARRFLRIIADNVARMERIVRDLLSLARLEQAEGEESPAREAVALDGVARRAAEAAAAAARERGVPVRLDLAEGVTVAGDAGMLEQAVLNLVDNAVKYSEAGRPVTVRLRREGDRAVLAVEDRGCGIPPEHLPRIFERFYRVDKARSRRLGGTGLGLAIVKHVVHLHGGRVEVDSTPGRGSTFRLVLPAAERRGDVAGS